MQDVAQLLRDHGHTVTSRWHTGVHSMDDGVQPDSGAGRELAARFAAEDLEDLLAATCVISFTEEPRTATRGGRHCEFGYGLAYGKRMIIVGPREMIFHYLPSVKKFDDTRRLMDWIAAWQGRSNPEQLPEPAPDNNATGALFNNEATGAARAIAGR
jgi:hypothetical protein